MLRRLKIMNGGTNNMSESKYPGYKKCFIDTETTGIDRKLHDIFQLSGCIEDIDGTVLEEFDFKFRPFSLEHVEQSAFDKTGVTYEELENLPMTSWQAYAAFINVLSKHCNKFDKKDKMQFIAYNAQFDSEFLREFFIKHEDNYFGSWFWSPQICALQLAASFLIDVRGALPNFQLATLCASAGFPWDESQAHNALYDIRQTRKLYHYLRENTRILGE